MSSGFSSGERPIPGTAAANPGPEKMRYKISKIHNPPKIKPIPSNLKKMRYKIF
jgi:hypothetical protein